MMELEGKLIGTGAGSIKATLAEIRVFVLSRLQNIRAVLSANVEQARRELFNHVDRIVIRPVSPDGSQFFVAEGEWDLLGNYKGRPLMDAPGNLEMVAGARFERATFGL